MTMDLFQRIIDELGDFLFLILLWDWGEPFLNPHIYDMIGEWLSILEEACPEEVRSLKQRNNFLGD